VDYIMMLSNRRAAPLDQLSDYPSEIGMGLDPVLSRTSLELQWAMNSCWIVSP
jgi:hypothetical protein